MVVPAVVEHGVPDRAGLGGGVVPSRQREQRRDVVDASHRGFRVFLVAPGPVDQLGLCRGDDVTLKRAAKHQPGWPVRQHRPESHVQDVHLEAVAVLATLRERDATRRHLHVAVVHALVPLVVAVAATVVHARVVAVAATVVAVVAVAAVVLDAVPVVLGEQVGGGGPVLRVVSVACRIQQPSVRVVEASTDLVVLPHLHTHAGAGNLVPHELQRVGEP